MWWRLFASVSPAVLTVVYHCSPFRFPAFDANVFYVTLPLPTINDRYRNLPCQLCKHRDTLVLDSRLQAMN